MIPAAIHGKGTRGWDMPLLSKRTGCSPLAGCEEQFHCSGLYLLGEGQDSLWAGISPSKHRTKPALTEGGNTPNPPAGPSWGCKGSAKPKENSDAVTATPKEKLLRAPNGQRVALLKIQMTQLWSESFYFCLLASVIWFPSYSLNHSEMCFCRQGQLCHSCFPNFKLEDIH